MSAVDEDTVLAVLDQVWESLLGEPVLAWSGPEPAGDVLRAEVLLTGDAGGRVRLACHAATARSLARAMLGLAPDAPVEEPDVLDAVGEVVNVVGGNVKGTLLGSTSLGLPHVSTGPLPAADAGGVRTLVERHGAPVVLDVDVRTSLDLLGAGT